MNAKEQIIVQIGELDDDIARLQEQLVAMHSRRWDLVVSLDDAETTAETVGWTGEHQAINPQTAETPAYASLVVDEGWTKPEPPPNPGEAAAAHPGPPRPTQAPLTFRRSRESYTPVGIALGDLDDNVLAQALVQPETYDPQTSGWPQVHLHYRNGRYQVALCGANTRPGWEWWNAHADGNGVITVCLNCVTRLRADR